MKRLKNVICKLNKYFLSNFRAASFVCFDSNDLLVPHLIEFLLILQYCRVSNVISNLSECKWKLTSFQATIAHA